MAKWGSKLDAIAVDKLHSIGPAIATAILLEMDSKGAAVRNPSAYIFKACANPDRAPPAPAPRMATQAAVELVPLSMIPRGRSTDPVSLWRATMDSDANDALDKAGHKHAREILTKLEAAGNIRNPSAYVVRAYKNLLDEHGGRLPPPLPLAEELDDAAREALAQIGPEAAAAILAALEEQQGKVRNPSAYVLKSVGNARKGDGAGGAFVSKELQESWAEGKGGGRKGGAGKGTALNAAPEGGGGLAALDEKARAALAELAPEEARRIEEDLEAKADSIRNPSAYVDRAAAKAKHAAALHDKLNAVDPPLDERCRSALLQLGVGPAHKILDALGKHEKVTNTSAYVMKAVNNERAAPVMQPAAKQARRW